MLTRFICTDNKETEIKDCLKLCRLNNRCMTLATLKKLSEVRVWKGIPSTTQLLKGTCEAKLEIENDYSEDPTKMMFRLLGTNVHAGLETDITGALLEEKLEINGITGIADIYETEGGARILTDYKTSGAFKVARALGLTYKYKSSETEVYKRKTTVKGIVYNAGDPKQVKEYYIDPDKVDCFDWIMQLNLYRIMFEKAGFPVDRLRVQAIVRDGGLRVAQTYGIDKQMYLIPIPIKDDDFVLDYFETKKKFLFEALENDVYEKCSIAETWEGRKCEKYCSVNSFCKYYQGE